MSYQLVTNATLKFLEALPEKASLTLGLSGGIDSVVLCHALAKNIHATPSLTSKKIQVQTCYIHHGLQKEADNWALFTQKISENLGLPYQFVQISVGSTARKGVEAAAREARYQALFDVCPADGYLLTGHHLNDQTETILLNLFRGSGVKGLLGMPASKYVAEQKAFLVRPLLTVSQQAIQDYAEHYQLQWVEDLSNQDNSFKRNYLRNDLLPKIRQGWSGVEGNVVRFSNHLRESQGLLDELAQSDLEKCTYHPLWICLEAVQTLSWPRQKNIIQYWLSEKALYSVRMTESIFEWLALNLQNDNGNAHALRKGKNFSLRVEKKTLFVLPLLAVKYRFPLNGFNALEQGFSENVLAERLLMLQVNNPFDRRVIRNISEVELGSNQPLKKWFKANSICLWNRSRWPVLAENGLLIEIIGFNSSLK